MLQKTIDTDMKRPKRSYSKEKSGRITRSIVSDATEKPTFPISKQLTAYRTKPQAKVTILGTDRATFACAMSMAVQRYASEIIIYDPSFNRQMKMCCHDLACAFQISPISRSVKLIYTSDTACTSRSDLILITEMHSRDARMKSSDQKSSFSLKQKAEEFIDRFRGVSPYDYNSSVINSLADNQCHAGQVCGLGPSLHSQRLRYAISELFNIPSVNITGFVLESSAQFVQPYWSSITINGQSLKLENKITEEHRANQSTSNNASRVKYPANEPMATEADGDMRVYKYITKTLMHTKIKRRVQQRSGQKCISSDYSKEHASLSSMNKKTSVQLQRWLQSSKNDREVMKGLRYRHKKTLDVSNNAANITELQLNLSQSMQDQLMQHLNAWQCLQLLYHRPCDYTLGMNLSRVSRSIMSNSEEILFLSTHLHSFLKQQSTNQIELEHDKLFATVPVQIRRYGIHAILHFKSQTELYNQVHKTLQQTQNFRNIMNYPLQKTSLIYEKQRM